MTDLHPDDHARLRRTFQHIDDLAPLAPDLDTLTRIHEVGGGRRRSRRLVPALAGAVVVLVAVGIVMATQGRQPIGSPAGTEGSQGQTVEVTLDISEVSFVGFDRVLGNRGKWHVAVVLYTGDPGSGEGLGGFATVIDRLPFSTTQTINQPTDVSPSLPYPFVTDEALRVQPGTYTIVVWLSNSWIRIYGRWLPSEEQGAWLLSCEHVIEVEGGRDTRLTITGGFGTDWDECTVLP